VEAAPAGALQRLIALLLLNRDVGLTIAGLIILTAFSVATPQFLTPNNLLNLLRNVSRILFVIFLDEMLGQRQNVFASITQWRKTGYFSNR